MLSHDDLYSVIEKTPLVSIDLLYINNNRVLLGKRLNEPAKGKLFNPGGKIFKNETIENAIQRLSLDEVNLKLDITRYEFRGVYQHFYDNNFRDSKISTHYISLCFVCNLKNNEIGYILNDNQHECFDFYSTLENFYDNENIHENVKEFFR